MPGEQCDRRAEPAAIGPAREGPARGAPAGAAAAAEGRIQALVSRAQAGDSGAFAQLYDLYAPRVLSYLRYHLGARGAADLAEDLAADVFLKVLEKLPTYRHRGAPFSAWLYRVAHNRLIDYRRAAARRQGVPLEACAEVGDPSAPRALEGALAHDRLARVLTGLTPDQRRVIVLRFLQDRSVAYTARLLAKHEDAVKQLQVRALRALRRALTRAEGGLPGRPADSAMG